MQDGIQQAESVTDEQAGAVDVQLCQASSDIPVLAVALWLHSSSERGPEHRPPLLPPQPHQFQ